MRGGEGGRVCYFIEVDGGGEARVGDVAVRSGRVALTRVHDGGLRGGIEEERNVVEFGVK